jgi:hypothetical protein
MCFHRQTHGQRYLRSFNNILLFEHTGVLPCFDAMCVNTERIFNLLPRHGSCRGEFIAYEACCLRWEIVVRMR